MESLHYLLMKSHTLFSQKIFSRALNIGLTPGQPKILEYLIEHDGSDQKTISAYCEISQATVGTILGGMEKSGLIERKQKHGNRRSLYVYLTDKGKKAASKMALIFAESEQTALKGFTDEEREQLLILLNKISATLDAERAERKEGKPLRDELK